VHVFHATKYTGIPTESEEMQPHWYSIDAIPYEKMWCDDKYWLPHLLNGKSVCGQFDFAADEETLLDYILDV